MKSYEINTSSYREEYIALIKRLFAKAGFSTYENEEEQVLTITAVGEDDEELLEQCEFFYLFN